MKENGQIKKFIIAFAISVFIFSFAAIVVSLGISLGRENNGSELDGQSSDIDGISFNILLVMSDYVPEKFDDYDPKNIENIFGKSAPTTDELPKSPLLGYRRIYTEDMVIVRFDNTLGKIILIPVSGSTLVNIKGVQIRLEDIAGEWGIDTLVEKVHAITGIEIDCYAVYSPENAAKAIDLVGGIDYTIKCNMSYFVPERGIDINITSGTYRLDGKTAVDMLRFNAYDGLGVTRSEVTLGYAQRFFNKITSDLTTDELSDIINRALALSNTNFEPDAKTEELSLMLAYPKLELKAENLEGKWQMVGDVWYFVLDETKTLEKLSVYRSSSLN